MNRSAWPTLVGATLVMLAPPAPAAAPRRPPNFVVILMDDMGWRDVGFMGNSFVETPAIDRLAATGVVFTQSYASAPNCAPTRACLMSGQLTPRHGIYTVVDPRQPAGSPWHKLIGAHSESELATEVVTLPEALKPAGYATAFFGMWNLGRGRTGPRTPGGQGFDTVVFPENLGFGKDAYFDGDGNYLSDRLADSAVAFIDDHRDRPFFVYLADHAVHAPYEPKPDLLAKYTKKATAGVDRRDDPAYAATIPARRATWPRPCPPRPRSSPPRCGPGNARPQPRSRTPRTPPTIPGRNVPAEASPTAAAGCNAHRNDRTRPSVRALLSRARPANRAGRARPRRSGRAATRATGSRDPDSPAARGERSRPGSR